MPFGVSTAPGWFQFVMTSILHSYNLIICAVYIDDVVVFANTWDECWNNTLLVIKILV